MKIVLVTDHRRDDYVENQLRDQFNAITLLLPEQLSGNFAGIDAALAEEPDVVLFDVPTLPYTWQGALLQIKFNVHPRLNQRPRPTYIICRGECPYYPKVRAAEFPPVYVEAAGAEREFAFWLTYNDYLSHVFAEVKGS